MARVASVAVPEWTETRDKSGLDPLGMQNSSVRLYQALLPGISNVTQRIRYYGFYAWLSLHYSTEIRDPNPKVWQQFLRRAEAAFALVAVLHGDRMGVAGSDWASRTLAVSGVQDILFSEATRADGESRYLKNEWGAYGAAYASQLVEVGILTEAAAHEIAVPSQEVGEALGLAFAASVGHAAADAFLRVVDRGVASRTALQELAPFAPSAIPSDSQERECYEQLLFARTGLQRENDFQRQRTLSLILRLAEAIGRLPKETDLRWCSYSEFITPSARWQLDHRLVHHRLQWRIYQANELCHVAYAALLKCLLDRLAIYPLGIELGSLIHELVNESVAEFEREPADWGAFLSGLRLSPSAATAADVDSELQNAGALLAVRKQSTFGSRECIQALQLLGRTQIRSRDIRESIEKEFSGLDSNLFRSVLTELRHLEAHASMPFRVLLTVIFEERVARRHLWIALRKLRYQGDYTFLFNSDEGLVSLRANHNPVLTTPRVSQAISFLQDVGLLNDTGLSGAGRQLLDASA